MHLCASAALSMGSTCMQQPLNMAAEQIWYAGRAVQGDLLARHHQHAAATATLPQALPWALSDTSCIAAPGGVILAARQRLLLSGGLSKTTMH